MSRRVTGYALVFNKRSADLGGFVEQIRPGALDGVLEKSDVLALLNHEQTKGVLARSTNLKGSLKLQVDSKGLKYSYDAPRTSLGEEVLEGLRRSDIRSSSFVFTVDDGQVWEKLPDGTILRTITKFDGIYDISQVYKPAYPDATAEIVE